MMSDKLLPPNATWLERLVADLINCRFENIFVPIETIWNLECCPDEFLPWLAWSLSVDTWQDGMEGWSETVKRDVIRNNAPVHKHKGTVASIKRALAAQGVQVDITEWWQCRPRRKAHTFYLDLAISKNRRKDPIKRYDTVFFQGLSRAVDEVKPVRSHYELRLIADLRTDLAAAPGLGLYDVLQAKAAPRCEAQVYALRQTVSVKPAPCIHTAQFAYLKARPAYADHAVKTNPSSS